MLTNEQRIGLTSTTSEVMTMTMVNAWLTDPQRNWLVNEYLNKLTSVDVTLIDDAYTALVHMKNPEFYRECKEFMPTCMQEMRDAGIR